MTVGVITTMKDSMTVGAIMGKCRTTTCGKREGLVDTPRPPPDPLTLPLPTAGLPMAMTGELEAMTGEPEAMGSELVPLTAARQGGLGGEGTMHLPHNPLTHPAVSLLCCYPRQWGL